MDVEKTQIGTSYFGRRLGREKEGTQRHLSEVKKIRLKMYYILWPVAERY